MKSWVKPGLETLNVSMTMNNNALNSVIVSAAEVITDPVETPIIDESTETVSDEIDIGTTTVTSEQNNTLEATNETVTEQETNSTNQSTEEDCITDDTSTDSETSGLFTEEAELFNESNISEEFQIEGGCINLLALDGEEMEKAIATLIES